MQRLSRNNLASDLHFQGLKDGSVERLLSPAAPLDRAREPLPSGSAHRPAPIEGG